GIKRQLRPHGRKIVRRKTDTFFQSPKEKQPQKSRQNIPAQFFSEFFLSPAVSKTVDPCQDSQDQNRKENRKSGQRAVKISLKNSLRFCPGHLIEKFLCLRKRHQICIIRKPEVLQFFLFFCPDGQEIFLFFQDSPD